MKGQRNPHNQSSAIANTHGISSYTAWDSECIQRFWNFFSVMSAGKTIAVLQPATRGSLILSLFWHSISGCSHQIGSPNLPPCNYPLRSIFQLQHKTAVHLLIQRSVFFFFPMCLSKKHILFIFCSSVITTASPHSIMSSQEAESPPTRWFKIVSTQFHLYIQS